MIDTLFHRIRHDETGTGVMELALGLPMFLLLFVGMIDISHVVAARIDAEQVAQRATDFALANRPADTQLNAKIRQIQEEAAKAPHIEKSDVAVDIFLECDGVREDNFKTICPVDEDMARFVSVEVDRDVDFFFDWGKLAAIFGSQVLGDGITVQGDSIVRFQ